MSTEELKEILASVYIAGVENGLQRTITDPREVMHRKESFVNANPLCDDASSFVNVHISKSIVSELEEARKWATKAETVDQVWQQLTDRINWLESQKEKTNE